VLSDVDYDACVGLIYDSVVEPLRLQHALTEIIRMVNAPGAHLVAFEKSTMEVRLSAITGLPLLAEIDYNERYAKLDPRAPFYLAARVGEWRSCHDYLSQDFVDKNEFFQDFLIPYGGRYCSCGKLYENDSYTVFLGVHRGIGLGPLDENAIHVLERLTPHLVRAMQLIFRHSQLQNQWAIVKATLDMLDYGAFVCDETASILVANESALARAEHDDGVRIVNGRLVLRDTTAQGQLRALLRSASETRDATNNATGILVPRALRLPLQLIARKVEPDRTLLRGGDRGLWSVMLSDPQETSAPTIRALSLLYGLTPAETRIATMLVAGFTVEQIANEIQISKNTVSTHLKSLFLKTSTARQAELVRLFSSPPAIRAPAASEN
jgi:DNA-binding CsgD family transcriptional regulator